MNTLRVSKLVAFGLLIPGLLSVPSLGRLPEVPSWIPEGLTAPTTGTGAAVVRYGGSALLGRGEARSYVTVDEWGRPSEVGIALDEGVLEQLPMTGAGHVGAHGPTHVFLLDLPAQAGIPFRFVELNWNPMGHEPAGVYQDVSHFDFHFYTVDPEVREAIVPSDPRWAERANRLPDQQYVPPFVAALAPPQAAPADIAIPLMGVHWVDVRTPEIQGLLGNPEGHRPFTKTFIHGSWDGRFIFWEPMITRAYLLAKKKATDPAVRDEIVPIPTPERYQTPGYYPSAYRITWDGERREWRIALTSLVERS